MHLSVEVISDVICPWCYIGKRRLEKAITDFQGRQEAQVRWLPFQLNPTMPKEGISRKDYRSRKFGSWERSLEIDAKVAAVGESEGIRFVFDRIERTPNTVDAHRLIWLADQNGCQDAVVEALFRAYFSEGRDIGNRQTLIDIVAGAGMKPPIAEAMLNGHAERGVLENAEEISQRHQVSSVPFFVINDGITLSGAQQSTVFLDAFNQAITTSNDSEKLKILFVCSRNKWRSPTAEKLWDGFRNYEARSAGTEKSARIKVTAGHIGWADLIVVMEKKHKRRLQTQFGHDLDRKEMVCLNIADDYDFMDSELISLLKSSLGEFIEVPD